MVFLKNSRNSGSLLATFIIELTILDENGGVISGGEPMGVSHTLLAMSNPIYVYIVNGFNLESQSK
jgi:hypothetical protein